MDSIDILLSVADSCKLNVLLHVQDVLGSNNGPETGCCLRGRSNPSWELVRLNRRGVGTRS